MCRDPQVIAPYNLAFPLKVGADGSVFLGGAQRKRQHQQQVDWLAPFLTLGRKSSPLDGAVDQLPKRNQRYYGLIRP